MGLPGWLKAGLWVVNPKLGLMALTISDGVEVTQELIEANKKKKEAEDKLRKLREEEARRIAAEIAERKRIFNKKLTGTRVMSAGRNRVASGGKGRVASKGVARIASSGSPVA